MVMEGASFGTGHLQRHYDHENGAGLIAMESAEALRDIFEATFYTPNTCTIAAAMEGYSSVEESATQSAIMEAAVANAFQKIKDFFIKLKDKVKEFIHNIKRYLTGIFGNDEKWVKTYEKELRAINSSDLKDYKVKMYNYTIMDVASTADLASKSEKLIKDAEDRINEIYRDSAKKTEADDSDVLAETMEKDYSDFIKELVGKSIDADELDKELWSQMRDGADNENDKEDVVVASSLGKMIDTLKKSSKDVSAYDSMISKTESMYNKAINLVNKEEKHFENQKADSEGNKHKDVKGTFTLGNGEHYQYNASYGAGAQSAVTAALRNYSSTLSKCQTAKNKQLTAAKSALTERNSAYKSALTGAFSYARKHKGGK
jgi:hypothetical protein